MATKTMIGGLLFCTVLVSEMILSASNPLELEVTFGRANQVKNDTERIYNGEVAEDHAYPWQVRLRWPKPGKPGFVGVCGGSIICPYFVMTAGHCVSAVQLYQLTIYAGINRLGDPGEQSRRVNRAIIHPEYVNQKKPFYLAWDFAILELSTPLYIRPETSPIYLPLQNQPNLNYGRGRGWNFAATGWGWTEAATDSRDLMVVAMYQYSPFQCPPRPDNICAGLGRPGKGTCNGDSGGITELYC